MEMALLGRLFCIPIMHFSLSERQHSAYIVFSLPFNCPISFVMFDVGSAEVPRGLIYLWQTCTVD